MQLVKTARDNLLHPLQMVGGIVERRQTLPVLGNILMKKEGETLFFLSTDTEIQITTTAAVGTGTDNAATTVAARKLLDILKNLSPSSEVALTLDDTRLTVQSGKSRFSMQTIDAEQFPVTTEKMEYDEGVEIPQKAFKALISMVYFAMAQPQDNRFYLSAMLLVIEGDLLIGVATDGHRLAYSQYQINRNKEATENQDENTEQKRKEVILPRKTVLELQRILADSDEPVRIQIGQTPPVGMPQIKLTFSGVEMISKLVDAKFPDYPRVIPKGYSNSFTIARELLQSALMRASIMTNDKFKGIRCIVNNNSLKIHSTNTEQEEALEEVEIEYSGDEIEIGFNVTYLLDVLTNLKNEKITVELGDSDSPALITLPDNPNFKYVVMPMRL